MIIPGNLNSSHPTEKLRFHLKLPFRRSGLPHYHTPLPRLALEVGFDGRDDLAVHDGSDGGLEREGWRNAKRLICFATFAPKTQES